MDEQVNVMHEVVNVMDEVVNVMDEVVNVMDELRGTRGVRGYPLVCTTHQNIYYKKFWTQEVQIG